MAFNLVQKFEFDRVGYNYDRSGDVLDISFGPPAPAVAVQVEDWLAIRIDCCPALLSGDYNGRIHKNIREAQSLR